VLDARQKPSSDETRSNFSPSLHSGLIGPVGLFVLLGLRSTKSSSSGIVLSIAGVPEVVRGESAWPLLNFVHGALFDALTGDLSDVLTRSSLEIGHHFLILYHCCATPDGPFALEKKDNSSIA
jgi:hypothetical protein